MEVAEETEMKISNSCIQHENADEVIKEEQPLLSKRQRKLLEKRKRWLELKPIRRAKEKEKRKLKLQMAKETGVSLRPSRKMLKASKMSNSSCKVKVCFDLSLGHLMTPPELSKALKQLHRCYSINRRAHAPLQLYITGYDEETKQVMNKLSSCFNWDINFHEQVYHKLFDKSDVIYLTSDSPNVIDSFDDSKVYIIGALVDHNRLKNICYEMAVQENVGHARLPLDTYFKFKTRTVLTVDQVYSIILKVTEGKTWISAISDIVPKRKGIEVKNDLSDNDEHISSNEILLNSGENANNNTICDESLMKSPGSTNNNQEEHDKNRTEDLNESETTDIVDS